MITSLFYGVLVALIWGVQPVISRYGFQAGLSAQDATLVRYLVSGLLMLPYAYKRGLANACGIGWRRALLLFFLSGPLFSLVLIGGVSFAPASHGALIHPALTPLFGALISRFALNRPERFSLFGMALLLGGVCLIGGDSLLSTGTETPAGAWRGDLLFVTSAFMWAWYMVLNKAWNMKPLDVVALVQVLSLSYVLPYLALNGMKTFDHPASALLLQAAYHGVLVSIVGVALFNWVVARLGVKAMMLSALSPLFGVAASALALDEPLRISVLIGAVAIVAGLAWSLRGTSTPRVLET
ncbi:DMT family transporter [Herbaspirillum chlorophenolicum]|uniref:DMT family transporter n=1 Tax=Herbaspirillum chlorophenolicum TaxID=211589 RepID=UPI00067D4357|nr:DMT family transporter [Herbaspirillum chlorophenolicum]